MYEVRITPEGLRHLDKLPAKVRDAALSCIWAVIAHDQHRVGKPLVGELEGLRSARRGDYRLIYEIHEDTRRVVVDRVQHRGDAYRSR